jgi:hypothetical protein
MPLTGAPQSTLEELEPAETVGRLGELSERMPDRENVPLGHVAQGERV